MSRFSSNAQGPALPECLLDRVDRRLASAAGAGWWSLLEEMHARLDAIEPRYRLSQVKEKLGVLRVYLADTSYERGLEAAADLKTVFSSTSAAQPKSVNTAAAQVNSSSFRRVGHSPRSAIAVRRLNV